VVKLLNRTVASIVHFLINLKTQTKMKKHIAKFSMITLCAAAILVVPASSRAQATNNAPAAVPAAAPAVSPVAAPVAAPATTPAAAQTAPVKKHTAAAPAAAPATLPFRGTVTTVDTNAMTLTVGKRTFNMTSETVVTKDDKPAVLADGAAGEPVRGAYKKNTDGKLDAVTIHFGGKQKEPAGN
jgi:hypothetical protein